MIRLRPEQIESWVAKHFEYKKRSGGKQLVINNPFNGDTGWHFWISTYQSVPKKQQALPKHKQRADYYCHDFRPGAWTGTFLKFVKEFRGIDYFEAAKEVRGGSAKSIRDAIRNEIAKIDQEEERPAIEPEEAVIELPSGSKPFTEEKGSMAWKIAMKYLQSRRIDEQTAIENFVHYRPGSIVFPYIEYGMMVYWQERSIIGKEFRNPDETRTGLQKSDFIYGFDNIEPSGTVILVESMFNSLSIGADTGATGGAEIIGKQMRKLRALNPQTIILAPDYDDAGIHSLKKNFYSLRELPAKLAYSLPPVPDMDWNDMDKERGKGAARRHIEGNTYALTVATVAKLSSGYKPKNNTVTS
jgi:DNA primase